MHILNHWLDNYPEVGKKELIIRELHRKHQCHIEELSHIVLPVPTASLVPAWTHRGDRNIKGLGKQIWRCVVQKNLHGTKCNQFLDITSLVEDALLCRLLSASHRLEECIPAPANHQKPYGTTSSHGIARTLPMFCSLLLWRTRCSLSHRRLEQKC